MVTLLAVLAVLAVLGVTAVLVRRGAPLLADSAPDRADLALPERPLRPTDISGVRFSRAARGYRTAEVDAVLSRLAEELADRDRRLASLEAAAAPGDPGDPGDLPVPPRPAGRLRWTDVLRRARIRP